MSNQMTLPGIDSAISLQELQAGQQLFDSHTGQMRLPFGPDHAPASHSVQQESSRGIKTNGTCGRSSATSSEPADRESSSVSKSPAQRSSELSRAIGQRLQAILPSGSMEYRQTWKLRATPSGRQFWAHTASAHRTSDSDCSGSHIVLSSGEKCLIDNEDHDFLSQWKWKKHKKGYAYRSTRNGNIYMHRVLMGLTKGDGVITDHIDRNKLNNRKGNLRAVTQSESNHNRSLSADGVCRPKGRNRWTVCLWINKQFQWLGSFATKDAAVKARVDALKQAGLVTAQTPSQLAGYPTPATNDTGQNESARQGSENLSVIAGWVTPSSRDHKDTPGMAMEAANPDGTTRARLDQLPRQAALVGYPTPNTRPEAPNGSTTRENGQQRARQTEQCLGAIAAAISGATVESSPAEKEKPGVLDPQLPCWLMGYSVDWLMFAPEKKPTRTAAPAR